MQGIPTVKSTATRAWRLTILCAAALSFAVPGTALAQDDKTAPELTVDRIFIDGEFRGEGMVPIRWLEDAGSGAYTTVEPSATQPGGRDILGHDPATGASTVLVSAEQLTRPDGTTIAISDYAWSDDGRYVLIQTDAVAFRRYQPFGNFWLLDLTTDSLRQIAADRPASSIAYAKLSPDATRVAYLFENNIYVENMADGSTVALTTDGDEFVVNGTGDWVNEEEFFLRDGFMWSPDSTQIAYWQFDTEGVGTFFMIDNLDGQYATPIPLQYPKAGTTNSAMRVGVADVATQRTVWADLTGDPRQTYVPTMQWADGSDEVILQFMNRLQNRNDVLLLDADTGTTRTVFTETDDAWVDPNYDLTFLDDGEAFTWLSERDGWRRLYRVDRDTGTARPITPAGRDVMSLESVDPEGGWAYYLASPDDNAARYLYRSALFGDADAQLLTPAGEPGMHGYSISPDGRWAVHSVSRFGEPRTVSLVSLPDHAAQRTILDNAVLREQLAALPQGDVEFFDVTIEDGTRIDGWMMFPPDFDPDRQYPLLMYVYGEPWGQTVQNSWDGSQFFWHLMLTQRGYIVASVDNRGTPAPRGRDWRKAVYGQIGILASADQAQAVQAMLAERPYLDPQRVGIWGWSGGGSMTLNAMFRYPEIYSTGIAVAAVSDQRLYDTIYQERYMGLPQGNPEGYREGSPINFAQNLQGELLLIHGTEDDNVHYQSAEQLIDRLIATNRDFDMMAYPGRSHGIWERQNTSRHLYRTMLEFLLENLPVGDPASD